MGLADDLGRAFSDQEAARGAVREVRQLEDWEYRLAAHPMLPGFWEMRLLRSYDLDDPAADSSAAWERQLFDASQQTITDQGLADLLLAQWEDPQPISLFGGGSAYLVMLLYRGRVFISVERGADRDEVDALKRAVVAEPDWAEASDRETLDALAARLPEPTPIVKARERREQAERIERELAAEEASAPAERQRQSIPEKVRHEVWRRDEGRCRNCGSQELLEFDHVIPFSRGGSNTARNLQLLCEPCNRKKSATI